MAIELTKTCEICGGSTKPIPCSAKKEASEHYCAKCHKSYSMSIEACNQYLAYEAQNRKQ